MIGLSHPGMRGEEHSDGEGQAVILQSDGHLFLVLILVLVRPC